jgi:cbb3-type cytochrome oxidase subunit 3
MNAVMRDLASRAEHTELLIVAMLLFMAIFVGFVVYAFWSGSKPRFDRAAQMPLEGDPEGEG